MKLINKTEYDKKYLRKMFMECERREGTDHKGRRVMVVPKRVLKRGIELLETNGVKRGSTAVSGQAYLNLPSIIMHLPQGRLSNGSRYQVNAREVIQVYLHELGHNLGLMHCDMVDVDDIDASWWPDECVPRAEEKPKERPKRDVVAERAKKVAAQLQKAKEKRVMLEVQLKRTATRIKRLGQKDQYYRKRLSERGGEGCGEEPGNGS